MATITITVGSQTGSFFSYATVATANAYMLGSINYESWQLFTDEKKEQVLIEASRVLDRQKWNSAYNTQALREAETNIVNACIELAFLFASGETDSITSPSTFDATKMSKAGSVQVENFRSLNVADKPKRFPTHIFELLSGYLGGGAGLAGFGGSWSYGTDNQSGAFDLWSFGK